MNDFFKLMESKRLAAAALGKKKLDFGNISSVPGTVLDLLCESSPLFLITSAGRC